MRGRKTAQHVGIEPSADFTTPTGSADYDPPAVIEPADVVQVLRYALHHMEARGGWIVPPHGDQEAYDMRLDLLRRVPERLGSDEPVITLPNLHILLDYAAHAAGHPDTERPKVYTLAEARPLVLGELCAREGGHQIEHTIIRTAGSAIAASQVRCTRCGATFTEDPH